MRILRKITKRELKDHLYELNTDDLSLYKEANNPNSIGIFQLNGALASEIIKKVRPSCFDEINAVSAFARPGTSSFVEQYVENRETKKSPYSNQVADLLTETNSICLYQEQAMSIFNKIGGFSLEECDGIRGLMKKLGKADKKKEDLDRWNVIIAQFNKGAVEKGMSIKDAKMIAADLLKMSSYNFNKCFSGDMVIDKDNSTGWVPTIEEMYLTRNDREWAKNNGHDFLHYKYKTKGYVSGFSLQEDGKLYKNKIKNIYFQGKKDVYRITLENGKMIEVTDNHRFPVIIEGEVEYKSIDSGLSINDSLLSNDGYEITDFKGKYNFTKKNNETRKFKTAVYYGSGEKNTGYINGESIKFKENRKILLEQAENICPICGNNINRKECHHIDGNRYNNELENLIVLCPSCHKKEDYKIGRNRKGDKGKITSLSKIVSIEKIGEKNTYDVEMNAPFHTVSVNGIVAHNSHSTAYAYIAAQTLYLSYYFRKYFYASVLHYEVGRDKYLIERLKAVKKQGFNILPPNINKSKVAISPTGDDNIVFGLFDIKGVGEVPATTIVSLQPFGSFEDFLIRILGQKVSVTVIKALIGVGAFDEIYNLDRKRLIETFDIYWKNKKSTKVPEKLLAVWEAAQEEIRAIPDMTASIEELRDLEKKYFGFNFFLSPFNEKFIDAVDLMVTKGMIYRNFEVIKTGSMKVPAIVSGIRILNDRNGNEMAFLELEDIEGESISIPIFQSFWKVLKARFIQGKVHMINLYYNKEQEQIMFGSKRFIKKETEISRLVKRLDNL